MSPYVARSSHSQQGQGYNAKSTYGRMTARTSEAHQHLRSTLILRVPGRYQGRFLQQS